MSFVFFPDLIPNPDSPVPLNNGKRETVWWDLQLDTKITFVYSFKMVFSAFCFLCFLSFSCCCLQNIQSNLKTIWPIHAVFPACSKKPPFLPTSLVVSGKILILVTLPLAPFTKHSTFSFISMVKTFLLSYFLSWLWLKITTVISY